jgi:hypothetical protein
MDLMILLAIITILLANFLLGFVLLSQLRIQLQSNLERYFLSQVFGLTAIVTIYALYKTGLNSIFIIVPFLLLVLFRFRKDFYRIKAFAFTKIFGLQLFVGISLCLVAYYFFYVFMDGALFGDNQFYASIAYALNQTGIETTNFDWTLTEKSATPYHYTESWFTALWSKLFQLNTLKTYYLLYIPVFGSTIFIGAFTLAKHLLKSVKYANVLSFIIALTFLLIQNVDFPFFKVVQNYYHIGSWFHNIKFSVIYIELLVFVILLLNRNLFAAYISLLLLVPLYSSISPAILSGLFVAILYLYYQKQIKKSDFVKLLVILLLIPAFYGLFYFLQPYKSESAALTNLDFMSVMFKTLKVFLKMVVFGFLPAFLLFTFFWFLKKNRFSSDSLSISQKYISALFWGLFASLLVLFMVVPLYFYVNHDAFQLLGNFVTPFFTLIFFICYILFLNNVGPKLILPSVVVTFVYFLILLSQNPSVSFNMVKESYFEQTCDKDYFEYIKSEVDKQPKAQFAYFRNYEGKYPMELKPFLFVPDNRIIHFKNDYVPISLSVVDMSDDVDVRYANKNDFAFYNYTIENGALSNDSLYLKFIQNNNIRFIIVEKNAKLPDVLRSKVTSEKTNDINGNIFYVLQ